MTITPLGGRGMIGGGLGRGYRRAAAAVPWWLAGGVAAANCVAAYQPKGAASLEASYVNLANPGTYNAAPGVAPTWDATNGWRFVGTSRTYLKSAPHTLNQTAIIRYTDAPLNSSGNLFGLADRWYVMPANSSSPSVILYYSGAQVKVAPGLTGGVIALSRTSGFRNGVEEASGMPGNAHTWVIAIGARSNDSTASSAGFYATCYAQAFALYNLNLSEAQVAAITVAMAAL